MNEREFKKILKKQDLSYEDIESFLKGERSKALTESKSGLFPRLFARRIKEPAEVIEKNIKQILKKIKPKDITSLITLMQGDEKLNQLVLENIPIIWEKANEGSRKNFRTHFFCNKFIRNIIKDYEQGEQAIEENIVSIMKSMQPKFFLESFEVLKNIDSQNVRNEIDKYYEANKEKILIDILVDKLEVKRDFDENKKKLEYVIENILENQNCGFSGIVQAISGNIDFVLENTPPDKVIQVNRILLNNPELRGISEQKFIKMWNILNSENTKENIEDADFLVSLLKKVNKESARFITENIDEILQNTKPEFFNILNTNVKDISEDVRNKLNRYYDLNKISIVNSILLDKTSANPENAKKYAEPLALMIDELLESQNLKYTDIKHMGTGSYSSVYGIGEKILKVGEPRAKYNILNHKRILQPLIRTNLIDDDNNPFACIEIAEMVEALDKFSIQPGKLDVLDRKELYEIYKELRKDGIIWSDVASRNLGILKKPNHVYLNDEVIKPDAQSRGFNRNVTEEVLEPGMLVIIDTDFIYDENEKNIEWMLHSESFEIEYQKELKEQRKNEELLQKRNNLNTNQKQVKKKDEQDGYDPEI